MGVTTRTVTVCTCDVCQRECQPDEGHITIEVNGGDRDVGPATINGMLTFYQPYGCDKGVVCTSCKLKWLRRYVDSHPAPHKSVSMPAAAQAEAAAGDARDREDAERYRLLRRKVCIVGGEFHILNLDPRYTAAPDAAVELDAAIDAAMSKENKA